LNGKDVLLTNASEVLFGTRSRPMSPISVWTASFVFIVGMVGLAAAQEPAPLPPPNVPAGPAALSLADLLQMTLDRNPRLAQAAFAIDAARGRALQAGLYPNPTVSVTGDELGDRTGPPGIWTAPMVSQEIVVGHKLELSRSAAHREVDQATLALIAERFNRFTAVRQSYFEVLTLQRRLTILETLAQLGKQSVQQTGRLLEAKQVARMDLLQLEVELERYAAEREATRRELPAAFRRLAASVGRAELPVAPLLGSLDSPVPDYDLDQAQRDMIEVHPDMHAARIGVDRARLLVQRARVEAIPNVTVGAGYTRQSQNQSNDWAIGVSVPVPLWNRNQGNVAAAEAQVGYAVQQVTRVENELTERLAIAYAGYASARERAERFHSAILPRARETNKLALEAYKGGQFEYLRVLEAQRTVAQADLEYNRALGETWRSASEIAGLLLEESWPACPPSELPEPRHAKE